MTSYFQGRLACQKSISLSFYC